MVSVPSTLLNQAACARVSLRPDASIAGRLAPPGHGQMVYVLARIGIRASFTNNARVIAIVGLTFMVLMVC